MTRVELVKEVIIVNNSFIHGGGVLWQQQLCNVIGHQLLPLASVLTPVLCKSSKLICILRM